jgi:hypothetical protein
MPLKLLPWKKRGKKRSPLFQKQKKTLATYRKRKNFSLKLDTKFFKKLIFFYYFLGFTVLTTTIYFFWFSNYFLVQDIRVFRQDSNSSIEISYWVLDDLNGKNIFLLDVSRIKDRLFDSQENLWKISVAKQFPKTIKVTLTSYTEIYNTIIKEKPYLLLSNGSLVPGSKEELLGIDLKFSSFPNFYEYKKVVPSGELKSIFNIEELLRKNFITAGIKDVNYYVTEKEAHFIMETWATLIFDLTKPIASQIEKLAVFHQENIEITNPTIIYIDLRIANRLYFCSTENEFTCNENLNFIYGIER